MAVLVIADLGGAATLNGLPAGAVTGVGSEGRLVLMLLNFRAVWSRGAVWPSTRPCQGRDRRFESGRDRHLTCPRLERWPSPVEGDGLENRYRGNPIVGSNPTLSAKFVFGLSLSGKPMGAFAPAFSSPSCANCVPSDTRSRPNRSVTCRSIPGSRWP